MSKYINVDDLRDAMYQETFEKDSKMQKWESGCWIRYKLFENVLDAMPSADVVEVVHCEDCKKFRNAICRKFMICTELTDYCSYGERREAGE